MARNLLASGLSQFIRNQVSIRKVFFLKRENGKESEPGKCNDIENIL